MSIIDATQRFQMVQAFPWCLCKPELFFVRLIIESRHHEHGPIDSKRGNERDFHV